MDHAERGGAFSPLNEQEFVLDDMPTGFHNPSTEAILVGDAVRALTRPDAPGVVRATVWGEDILYLVEWNDGAKGWFRRAHLKRAGP